MRNTGRLYAFDVSDKRLANLKPRLARSGCPTFIRRASSMSATRRSSAWPARPTACWSTPCSGLGTLRRNPDLKWRQDEASVAELTVKQAAIPLLRRLVRPGGRLVYATCSLLAEKTMRSSLPSFAASRFQPAVRLRPCSRQGIACRVTHAAPAAAQHNTDGFFAAAMEHKA